MSVGAKLMLNGRGGHGGGINAGSHRAAVAIASIVASMTSAGSRCRGCGGGRVYSCASAAVFGSGVAADLRWPFARVRYSE